MLKLLPPTLFLQILVSEKLRINCKLMRTILRPGMEGATERELAERSGAMRLCRNPGTPVANRTCAQKKSF